MGAFAQAMQSMRGLAQRGASWELPNRGDEYPPGTIYPPLPGGMNFNPNAVLDPSKVEDRRLSPAEDAATGDDHDWMGGAAGGGGGGAWLGEFGESLADVEELVQDDGGGGKGLRALLEQVFGIQQPFNAGQGLGLMGLAQGGVDSPGGGPLRGSTDYHQSGGFSAAPPGQDFQGRDLTPGLVNYQGVETRPEYARLIKAAELKLGMPEISDFAGSDYRSHDEQVALYADHLAGRHPAPVAPPGQSYHEQGEAIDWDSGWLAQNPQVRNFLTNHGVVFDVPGESWHGHLASAPHVGGILRRYGRPATATGNQGRPITTERRRSSPPPVARPTRYR
jgi:hypothetical protein